MNVLAFKLSPLGDTVMFLPVVQTLRREFPQWRLHLFAAPAAAPLFRDTLTPNDLTVLETDRLRRAWRHPVTLLTWWRRVKRLRPDAVLLSYDQSSVARFLAAASGARVRIAGAGSVIRWQRGATHLVEKTPSHTLAEWDWAMAGQMMRELRRPWPTQPPAPVLPTPSSSPTPKRARPRVIVHPGASRPYQRWAPDRFAALATALARDCDVLWIDRPEIDAAPPPGIARATPSDVLAFLDLASGADLFVGNHSGAFHLAAALGVRCVIVAGPSPVFCDPPWHRDRRVILRAPNLACLPCDKLTVSVGECQNTASPMACMAHWSVETVESLCRDQLK